MMGSENDGTEKKEVNNKATDEAKTKEGKTPGSRASVKVKPNKGIKLLESQGFIVGKNLGTGSYASVKSAYDINRKHKVAIKIIIKKKSFDEYLNKFCPREMEAMRALGHHYALVRFYQIIETTSRYFFIMELAENGDLLSEIKAREYILEDQAGKWFISMHDGIRYMHGKGIVHRDIKCENLVLSKENTLKLTDFGFAKQIGKAKNGGPLLSETFCGSYAYAAPEILKGTPYNPEVSDVWSMGVVLYTMVYGRLPFDDGDHKKLLKQVQSRVVFLSKPEVSEQCRMLISKIFTKACDRVPLKNIKSDAWFKLHEESIKIEAIDRSIRDTNLADDRKSEEPSSSKSVVKADDKAEKKINEDALTTYIVDESDFPRTSEVEVMCRSDKAEDFC